MADSSVQIRRAVASDADVIARFNIAMALETEQLQLDPPTVARGVRRALDDDAKAIYFVATIDDLVIGQLMITHEWSDWRDGDMWWIQSVYVSPEARRQGVFRALYEHARHAARTAGARVLRLYVEKHNRAAQQTYTSLGMQLTDYLVMEEPLQE
ncbi:MAG TPA: GNAT family N-acetyltransferase [Tepidisphaeraceae bacterium]|nr:GNAT family N-acetyltransferase [Tepidisphaeraceae bacterium]